MNYTVKELITLSNNIEESSNLNEFVQNSRVNERNFMNVISTLLREKVGSEMKLRKKRLIKIIDEYRKSPDNIGGRVEDLINYINLDSTRDVIITTFSTKRNVITEEMCDYYIKDFNEYLNMFVQNTTISELINYCK